MMSRFARFARFAHCRGAHAPQFLGVLIAKGIASLLPLRAAAGGAPLGRYALLSCRK